MRNSNYYTNVFRVDKLIILIVDIKTRWCYPACSACTRHRRITGVWAVGRHFVFHAISDFAGYLHLLRWGWWLWKLRQSQLNFRLRLSQNLIMTDSFLCDCRLVHIRCQSMSQLPRLLSTLICCQWLRTHKNKIRFIICHCGSISVF